MSYQHLDFTIEQVEKIMVRAGEIAVERALDTYALSIVDPMTLKDGLGKEERCADLIDHMIRSDEGLGWSGRTEYRYNGDSFQWCGAFAAYCQPFIALELRRLYWASTDRLNAYLQHKPLFGTKNERAVMARFPKRHQEEFERETGKRWTPSYARIYGTFDQDSINGSVLMRAGDIGLFGPAWARSNFRPFGQHVTVFKGYEIRGRQWFCDLYEGNATGEIPGRPETVKHPVQGVIHMKRPIGLHDGQSLDDYHLRRWGRWSFFDIDLDLFEEYSGGFLSQLVSEG